MEPPYKYHWAVSTVDNDSFLGHSGLDAAIDHTSRCVEQSSTSSTPQSR
jgi:hypothetical protein